MGVLRSLGDVGTPTSIASSYLRGTRYLVEVARDVEPAVLGGKVSVCIEVGGLDDSQVVTRPRGCRYGVFVFDIEGYEPNWQSGASTLRRVHGSELAELAGRRFTACWLVWDASDDSWFADVPVVLDFDGRQLEICHHKFDELDIAWNRIDLARPIPWRYEEDGPMPLSWRNDRMPVLEKFRGEILRECVLQEWIGDDVANGMIAVGFSFDKGEFLVSNGLDENQIDVGPVDEPYRKVS